MDWKEQRLGKFTASEIHKLLGDGKVRETYIFEKACEILTGEIASDISGLKAIEWGKKLEKEAYSLWKGDEKGHLGETFFKYNDWSGGSPDGQVLDAVIEIKCPFNSSNHLINMQMKSCSDLLKLHKDYYTQIQFNMMCTKSGHGVFISYDPRFIEANKRIKMLVINDNKDFQNKLIERLDLAITELKQLIN